MRNELPIEAIQSDIFINFSALFNKEDILNCRINAIRANDWIVAVTKNNADEEIIKNALNEEIDRKKRKTKKNTQ